MKVLVIAAVATAVLAVTPLQAQTIDVVQNGSRAVAKGSAQFFTGAVMVEPLFGTNEQRPFSGGHVTFEPGARTAWHTHPAGQTLIVTSGAGWLQQWASERREIKPGDVVWIPPGVKHWHGATITTALSHIALQESVAGKNVDWLEQVADEQYRK